MITEIESILASGQSRKMANVVIDIILEDESRIDELMQCFFSDHLRTCQHAADIAMQYPELKEEVIAAIDYRMPNGSSGIRARGAKELRRMMK